VAAWQMTAKFAESRMDIVVMPNLCNARKVPNFKLEFAILHAIMVPMAKAHSAGASAHVTPKSAANSAWGKVKRVMNTPWRLLLLS